MNLDLNFGKYDYLAYYFTIVCRSTNPSDNHGFAPWSLYLPTRSDVLPLD